MTRAGSRQSPTRLMLIGFAIWLAATVAVRLMGQWLFVPGNGIVTVLVFVVGAAGMLALMRGLIRRFGPDRPTATAAWLLLPELFLDGLTLPTFGLVFPNMLPEAAGLFGGWLLVLYGASFLSALTAPGES